VIKKVWLKQFRNLKETVLEIDPLVPISIWGRNNQGKTNFLEALYMLSHGIPPVEKHIEHTVRFECDEALLGADIEKNDEYFRVYLKLICDGKRSVVVNNTPLRGVGKLKHFLYSDYISADVIRIFQDSPDFRRRDLDRFISALEPEYEVVLKHYQRLIKQKNAALKNKDKLAYSVIEVLNQQLIPLACEIVQKRVTMCQRLTQELNIVLKHLFPEYADHSEIIYHRHRLSGDDLESYGQELAQQMAEDFPKESHLGYGLVGPQRDDFSINVLGKSLFSFFSRGINRSFAICLKVIQLRLIAEKNHIRPLLLLDDTFAELHEDVKVKLCRLLESDMSLVYTSVLPEDESLFEHVDSYQMVDGELIHGKTR